MKMQVYKRSIVTAVLTIIAFALTFVISCTSKEPVLNGNFINPCDGVACYNGGTCISGKCNCPEGYEGVDCKNIWNQRFNANYIANDACITSSAYLVNVAPIAGSTTGVRFTNLSLVAPGTIFDGKINIDNTSITIQNIKVNDSIYVSGLATQTTNQEYINVTLTARDSFNHLSQSCSIVMAKQ
jgi:hypothetical protein